MSTVTHEQSLAEDAGFMCDVCLSGYILKRLYAQASNAEQAEAFLHVFLQTCANQLKVAYTDNKVWNSIRLYYPMLNPATGHLSPEEVMIVTNDNGEVTITATAELAQKTIH